MNNFDFLIHLDNINRISNTHNYLCYDNGYISYFRSLSLSNAVNIIKNTLLQKIIEKQIIYKNTTYLEQINNCIDYCIKNLKNINDNNIYSNEEMEQINNLINLIVEENEKSNNYIEKKKCKKVVETNDSISINIEEQNPLIENNSNMQSYTFCDKIYSISLKIKNFIKITFKKTVNYFSNLMNDK